MIPARSIALVVAALFVVAVPVRGQTLRAPEIEDVPAPIEDLLTDYSRAWETKDAELLDATVGGELLTSERRALANAEAVPFERFVVRVTTQYSGNLAGRRIRAAYPRREVRTYHVVEETSIGAETGTFVEDGAYTFVRSGSGGRYDGWRLASKDDLNALGFFSPYHLWDDSEVTVLRGDRFTVLTHPEVADVIRPTLDVSEDAYDHDDAFWPGPQRDHYVVIVPATTDELGRILHETIDLGKFVAFVAGGADRSEGWEPAGPRVFIHLSHLRVYPRAAQHEILAHELIHAITRPISGPNVPTWVEEGLANLGGGSGGRSSRASVGATPDDFPTSDRFVTGDVGGIQTVYDQSELAIRILEQRFGREGLVRFYETLGSKRVVLGTEEYWVKRAVRESVGWSYDQWVAAWRAELG